jgi:hypothetical protein
VPLPVGFEADVTTLPSPVSRGSVPPRSNWSRALTPLFTHVQLLRTPKITRVAPPLEHCHPELTSPPHRHIVSSLRPRRSRLARHLPLFLRELSPPVSPHLVTRLDVADRDSPPPHAWPPRGDHRRCVRAAPHLSRPSQVAAGPRQSGREAMMAGCRSRPPRPIGLRPQAGFGPLAPFPF